MKFLATIDHGDAVSIGNSLCSTVFDQDWFIAGVGWSRKADGRLCLEIDAIHKSYMTLFMQANLETIYCKTRWPDSFRFGCD